MALYQFIQADEQEQSEAIWDGEFLSEGEDEEHRILLYKDDFFVKCSIIKNTISLGSSDHLKA